jgi:hypothetical protein
MLGSMRSTKAPILFICDSDSSVMQLLVADLTLLFCLGFLTEKRLGERLGLLSR